MALASEVILTGLFFVAILFRIYTWGNRPTTEMEQISDLAGFLQISEFELFQEAAKFSDCRNPKSVRQDFISYLKYDAVPFYVRWYLNNQNR